MPYKRPGLALDLALDRNKAVDRKSLYIKEQRIAVYTALFGSYDFVRDPLLQPDNIDYYILTDQVIPERSVWKRIDISAVVPLEYQSDPVLCNRWCKMHPQTLFKEYQYSVYIDSNIWVFSDLGLLEASVIARKHSDPRCLDLMDSWWESFLRNSKRDQILLIDCLWLKGINPSVIGTLGNNLQRCDLFVQMSHTGPEAAGEPA